MKVAVKYCGHCNPLIDGPAILDRVKKQLNNVQFVNSKDDQGDVLLVISGCPVDCATRPTHTGPVITIAGPSLDSLNVAEKDLPGEILKRISLYQNQFSVQKKKKKDSAHEASL